VLQAWGPAEGLHVGGVLGLLAQGPRVWVGGELGLAAIVDGRVHAPLFAGDGSPTGVSGIVSDTASGDLWINSAQGILRLPADEMAHALRDPAYRMTTERLDFRDGLDGAPAQLRPVPTAVGGLDGRLWFSTNNSLVWIDPRHIRRNAVAPGVQIRQVSASGRDWPLGAAVLPAGTRDIDIRYTATALAQPERVRFRLRLLGVDADWRDVGTQRAAHYSNLAPGRYEFSVQAANEDGVWSAQPATLAFDLTPSIFQTLWFRLLCVLPGLALAWWLMRWRLHRLAQRFADRHEARLVERERIARDLHDTLLQSVQGLILRLQANLNRLVPTDPVRQALERTVDRAEQVLAEARGQVTGLRVLRSRSVPLGRALERAGEELALEHQRRFVAVVPDDEEGLPDDLHDEVLHIGLEALRNAFRHGGAEQVRLTLRRTPVRLVLEVADDGRGIARARERSAMDDGHWGLSGMRERAHAIGARLHVDSVPDAGTRVRLSLKLRRSARRHPLPWSTS
jgi:signal transduction histidine kinase